MVLRPDLVLVALPPREERRTSAGIVLLAPPRDAAPTYGLVRQVGARVTDVVVGERVVFSALVGLELDLGGWPHLLVCETDLDAVIGPDR
jgi:co-chaperonin GroES (HSP10)